jgi:hypothetical protein
MSFLAFERNEWVKPYKTLRIEIVSKRAKIEKRVPKMG